MECRVSITAMIVQKNDGATMIHNICRLANKRYFIYIYIFYHNNPHYFQFKTVATIHFYEIFQRRYCNDVATG